ncbi:MAG: leucine-rich repeat domain-containing protein, partial [Bacteroidaceae bacterium]|nr:leucine-rich repeat domain-containing protein [Bacteroidaceae bacterium]
FASLTSLEIPSYVTSLGMYCFPDCSSLTSVEIPSSVTSLGWNCFWGCSSLKIVICKMENVINDNYLFAMTPIEDATLYVPKELLDIYKSTKPWKDFGTILPLTDEQVSVEGTPELGIALNTSNGNIVVSGLADGTQVSCYTVDGRMLGKASADGGTASFTAEPNSVVIVKAGKKTFKAYVK